MKIGIIGAGHIAETMARTLRGMDDMESYAVAARELSRAEDFARRWGFEKAYGSYEALAADAQVDLIYIATPHSHHYAHARLCIEHGKPVLCEKAFMANGIQAREIFELAREKGVFITEAIWTRYLPSRQMIDRIIAGGEIGEVHTVTANLGYDIRHKERIMRPELAGGALLDVGIYPLNFASMVLGDDVESMISECVKFDTGVDAQSAIILKYKNGAMASLQCSALTATSREGVIYGTKGYLTVDNINNISLIRVYSKDRQLVREEKAPPQITGFEYQLEACAKALRQGKLECAEMPHEESIRMMDWMDSLRQSWGVVYPFEQQKD